MGKTQPDADAEGHHDHEASWEDALSLYSSYTAKLQNKDGLSTTSFFIGVYALLEPDSSLCAIGGRNKYS